jgi:multicomponent K+:H+ antiporter subunit D
MIFWKTEPAAEDAPPAAGPAPSLALPASAAMSLGAAIVALTVFAGPVTAYLETAAAQLYDPADYLAAVLGGGEDT